MQLFCEGFLRTLTIKQPDEDQEKQQTSWEEICGEDKSRVQLENNILSFEHFTEHCAAIRKTGIMAAFPLKRHKAYTGSIAACFFFRFTICCYFVLATKLNMLKFVSVLKQNVKEYMGRRYFCMSLYHLWHFHSQAFITWRKCPLSFADICFRF